MCVFALSRSLIDLLLASVIAQKTRERQKFNFLLGGRQIVYNLQNGNDEYDLIKQIACAAENFHGSEFLELLRTSLCVREWTQVNEAIENYLASGDPATSFRNLRLTQAALGVALERTELLTQRDLAENFEAQVHQLESLVDAEFHNLALRLLETAAVMPQNKDPKKQLRLLLLRLTIYNELRQFGDEREQLIYEI